MTAPKIVLIDNYDSFVHNLARYMRELGAETSVVRNDAMSVDELARLEADAVVISPGPCSPGEAGISVALFSALPATPILGVCLGHQALGVAYGATVGQVPPVHGKQSRIRHDGSALFKDLPNPLAVGRYHSLGVVDLGGSPLIQTAWGPGGEIMAMRHPDRPHMGVQFHPESILTPDGRALLANFLTIAQAAPRTEPANQWASAS